MPSGAKYISQFADGSPVQAADLFVIERALASLKLPFSSIIPGTAGRVQIGGNPGLVDDANFFWDVSNHRLGVGTGSPNYTLDVLASNDAAAFRDSGTYDWTAGGRVASSLVKIGLDSNGGGLVITGAARNGEPFLGVFNRFGTLMFRVSDSGGTEIGGGTRLAVSAGFAGGGFLNLNTVVTRNIFSENNDINNPAACFMDQRAGPWVAERTFPLVWWGGGTLPIQSTIKGGLNALDDGTRIGTAFYSYTGAALVENFRILDDQTFRLPAGAVIWNNGVQVLGARDTGWTAQTAGASKADLGATPTVGALASWAAAVQAALTTHGIVGA
jgi:hypothetical protein